LRDRDVMNLLDQIELYVVGIGGERNAQKDYWLFIYNSMRSGLLMTKDMEKHLQYKLKGLGIENPRR